MTWITGWAYRPTLISGKAASAATWSGWDVSDQADFAALEGADRRLAAGHLDLADSVDSRA